MARFWVAVQHWHITQKTGFARKTTQPSRQARYRSPSPYIVMAYIVMAYIVMAYIVMAYIVMAYIVMAYTIEAGKISQTVAMSRYNLTFVQLNNAYPPLAIEWIKGVKGVPRKMYVEDDVEALAIRLKKDRALFGKRTPPVVRTVPPPSTVDIVSECFKNLSAEYPSTLSLFATPFRPITRPTPRTPKPTTGLSTEVVNDPLRRTRRSNPLPADKPTATKLESVFKDQDHVLIEWLNAVTSDCPERLMSAAGMRAEVSEKMAGLDFDDWEDFRDTCEISERDAAYIAARTTAEVYGHELELRQLELRGPCPHCDVGSGKPKGHKGRHTGKGNSTAATSGSKIARRTVAEEDEVDEVEYEWEDFDEMDGESEDEDVRKDSKPVLPQWWRQGIGRVVKCVFRHVQTHSSSWL